MPKSLPDYIRVYARVLGSEMPIHRNAICLWSPDTNQNVAQDLQEKHCTLGDVGMFDSSSNFEVFFNIFMSREENIQMNYRPPENFSPLEARHYGIIRPVLEDNNQICTSDFRKIHIENKETGSFSLDLLTL